MSDVTLKAILIGDDRSLSKAMKGAGKSVEDVGKKSRTAGEIMKGILGSQIVSGAVDSLAQLVGEAARATDQTDKFKQTLSFAGFKNSAIKKATKDAQDYADATVYDLGTIQNTTAQLAANGVKNYSGLTQAVGNLNAVSGGSADTFKSVAMMLTQTAGAGKLTTENWNQLADAIPGASGVLQEQMRKNGAFTGDFRTAMAKGQITAAEFNKAIMQLGNKPVAVEAAKSTKTFEGAVGNLEATITGHLAGAIESVKPILIDLVNGFTSVVDKMAEFPGWVSQNSGALTALGTVVGVLAAGYLALAAAQGVSTAAAAVQAAGGIIAFLKAWATQQAILNTIMSANPIALIVIAIAALVAGIIVAYNNVEWFRNGVNAAFEAIGAVGRWLWNNALAPVLRGIVTGFAWVVDGIANFLDALGNIPGFGWAKDAANGLRGVAQGARAAADGIRDIPDPTIETSEIRSKMAEIDKKIGELNNKKVVLKSKGDTKGVKKVDDAIRKLEQQKNDIKVGVGLEKSGPQKAVVKTTGGGVTTMRLMAGGGRPRRGEPVIVGEDGWEVFVPDVPGRILNQRQLAASASGGGLLLPDASQLIRGRRSVDASAAVGRAGSGGGDTYNVTLTAPPGAPDAWVKDIESRLYGLMKSRGPGGKLRFQKGNS